jgi:hypothetical protein
MLFVSPITRVPAFMTQKQVIPRIDGLRFVVSSSSHFFSGNRKGKRPQYKTTSTPARLPACER